MDDVARSFLDSLHRRISMVPSPLGANLLHGMSPGNYHITIYQTATGLAYRLVDRLTERHSTFEDFLTFNHRIHRISHFFTTVPAVGPANPHLVNGRLAEMLKFISNYCLAELNLREIDKWSKPEKRILKKFLNTEENLRVHSVTIPYAPGYDSIVRKRCESGKLTALWLLKEWPSDLRDVLEAHVCHPQFHALGASQYQCFEMENLKRIMAYWKAMDAKWECSYIRMKTDRNLGDDLATWMTGCGCTGNRHFLAKQGKHIAYVDCRDESCSFLFGTFRTVDVCDAFHVYDCFVGGILSGVDI